MSDQQPRPAAAPTTYGVWLLILLLTGAAAALQWALPHDLHARAASDPFSWAGLTAGFALAELCVVHLTVRREAISFACAEVPWVLGLFLVSPGQLVVARVVGGAVALVWHRRQSLVKLAFNLAQCWLGAVAAVAVWRVAVGAADPLSMRGWLAAVGSAAAIEVVSALAVTAVITLRDGRSGPVPVALLTGVSASVANASFALVTLEVLRSNWLGFWTIAVLALFLGLAQRAHLALLRRHDAMERLQVFTHRVGSSGLELDAVVHEVLTGVRELLEVETVVLDLTHPPTTWRCDSDGIRQDAPPDRLPEPSSAQPQSRGAHVADLTVALKDDGEPFGALTVSGRLGAVGGLRLSDLLLLEAVAGHAAIGLQNGRLADQLRQNAADSEYQALHDDLTGLPNRPLFERVTTEVLEAYPESAVLLLDLDRFKEVNDTLGHEVGDTVLQEVARRLLDALPHASCVARLGGDEFAVVLAGAGLAAAEQCAFVIAATLAVPLDFPDVRLALDATVGVALAAHGDSDVADLRRRAEVAMYDAKDQHSGVAVYSPERDHHSAQRLSLVSDLRTAISSGELFLAYQPQARTADGSVASVEALVRWQSPARGVVPPDEFIGVAERTGLIGPLTDWVLRTALAQCRRWLDEGLDLSVAVNLSPRTLHETSFVRRLESMLSEAGVPPPRLILEITEGAILADPERAVDVLWELRRAGVRLSIDDLGVGHSSLTYLKKLPVHEIKIDRSFVTRMVDDNADEAIVTAVIQLVHRLGMTVVAEGVEDERTWARLRLLAADSVQGHWLSRPLPAEQLGPWLRDRVVSRGIVLPMSGPIVFHRS